MKLTLHVGLPKTATTYVQHTLSDAKRTLLDKGVIYPGSSVQHHDIPANLELAILGLKPYGRRADALLAAFETEVRESGAEHLLISTEYLIETSAEALALLHKKLRARFPALREVVALCYVREPIAFATSFCQQVVKSAHQRLEDFYRNPWPLNLRDCLARLGGEFGRDAIRVRNFHPDALKDGDVLADFVDALGIQDWSITPPERLLNQALSSEGLQIADALAVLRPVEDRRRQFRRLYRRQLEAIPGKKFVLPSDVQTRVIERSRQDLAMLKAEFGIELVPKRQPVDKVYAMPAETAEALARLVIEAVERPPR
ncbi:MAG: hypothetical protein U1E58_15440 [Tabrizicola sp.]